MRDKQLLGDQGLAQLLLNGQGFFASDASVSGGVAAAPGAGTRVIVQTVSGVLGWGDAGAPSVLPVAKPPQLLAEVPLVFGGLSQGLVNLVDVVLVVTCPKPLIFFSCA